MGINQTLNDEFKTKMMQEFKMKDLGDALLPRNRSTQK